jgi:hypothetical protein
MGLLLRSWEVTLKLERITALSKPIKINGALNDKNNKTIQV